MQFHKAAFGWKKQDYETAWAAAMEEGNRSMRCGGRSTWSRQDYENAVGEHSRIMGKLFNRANQELAGGNGQTLDDG